MVLLDTNILIHLFKNDESTTLITSKIGEENLIVSGISVMELYQGMRNKNEMAWMKARLKYLRIIQVDGNISKRAIQLMLDYRLSDGITIPDALIAATALEYEYELFTFNQKDFKNIAGIRLHPMTV